MGNALLVVVALAPIGAYVLVAVQRIGYRYELSFFEGSTVEVTARVVQGQPLYGPPTTDFTPWPYPPMYFWLTGLLARVTGLSLFPLRLVSVAASLLVLLLIATIVRRASGSVVSGVVAAGLYAASYRVSGAWADTARVDSLLLAFLLAAILIGLRGSTVRRGTAVGGLLFLAFLTKQNALFVAAPVLVELLMYRRRVGIAATATLGLGVVASTVVGDAVTHGWYSPYVVTQLLHQPLAPRWWWEFWLVDLLLPFAVAIGVALVLWRRFRPATSGPARSSAARTGLDRLTRSSSTRSSSTRLRIGDDALYLPACGVGLVLAALAGRLHAGGYANVAMPAHAGVAIGFGLVLAMALRNPARTPRLAPLVAAALAVQFVAMTLWRLHVVPTEADRAAGDSLVATVRALPGRVLIPSHPYYLKLAGMPTHASSIAIGDVLHSRGGRGRDAMAAALPWNLSGVSAVILDTPGDAALFGDALTRDFTLIRDPLFADGVFVPVTDTPTRPSLLYVRTSAIESR